MILLRGSEGEGSSETMVYSASMYMWGDARLYSRRAARLSSLQIQPSPMKDDGFLFSNGKGVGVDMGKDTSSLGACLWRHKEKKLENKIIDLSDRVH